MIKIEGDNVRIDMSFKDLLHFISSIEYVAADYSSRATDCCIHAGKLATILFFSTNIRKELDGMLADCFIAKRTNEEK